MIRSLPVFKSFIGEELCISRKVSNEGWGWVVCDYLTSCLC